MASAPLPDAPSTAARADARTAADWRGLFDSAAETDCAVTEREGAVPEGLVGTLFRNGPGQRDFAGSFFDGDGMIRAVRFGADGSVHYRSRLVQTPKVQAERERGRPLYRTAGTNLPGGVLRNAFRLPAHTANTSVVNHAGSVWALEEGGHPYDIDPESLATGELLDFDGALAPRTAFTAHPHFDPDGTLWGFGVAFGRTPELRAFRVDGAKRMQPVGRVPLPGATFVHDYALSPRWMTFLMPPVFASAPRFLLGLDSFFDTLRWQPEKGVRIAMLPREGGEPVWLESDTFMVGHTVSAWEEGDEVVADVCRLDAWPDIGDAARDHRESDWGGYATGGVWRYRLDPIRKRVHGEPLCERPAEFPRIDERCESRPARHAWFAANTRDDEGGWYRAVLSLDRATGETRTWDFGRRCAVMEPVFVPRPGSGEEGDGWVVAFVYDTDRGATDVAILDARQVDEGPVCTLHLPFNAGITFHGAWMPAPR